MKTTAVLLALATAAIAAPALHEDLADERTLVKYQDSRDIITRERKSTHESSSSPIPGTPVGVPTSQISEFGVTGKSFNVKKPIIIKKNTGHTYQVYRDSDEEKLDSPEPCRKQVKVKLCDHSTHSDMVKSATVEDPLIEMTHDDMKQSIKLAKEAVENLQQDMKNKDNKPSKITHSKHGESKSDVELHQDIEVARQALEHIHNNFGNLENPTSHGLALKEAEVVEDVPFPLAQTEEERLAQWKEAIENIQRNVDIVRNIEDSFKSNQDEISHTEEAAKPMKDITKTELHKLSTTHDLRVSGNLEMDHIPNLENMEHNSVPKISSGHEMMKAADLPEKDMVGSASMVSASKLQAVNHDEKARRTSDNHFNAENIALNKQALDTINLDHLPQNTDIKTVEELKERKTKNDPQHLEVSPKSQNKMKSTESELLLEKQKNAMKELHGTTNTEETEDKKNEMKSVNHEDMKPKTDVKNLQELTSVEQFKEADSFENGVMGPANMNKDFSTNTNARENQIHKDHTLNVGKMALPKNAMSPFMAAESLTVDQLRPMGMKTAEDMKLMQNPVDTQQMRWSQDKNFNSEMGLMKSAVQTHHHATDHATHMHGHHHTHQYANAHHLGTAHGHPRHQDHFTTNGKSSEMDQSNFFMKMRDSDSLGQDGQRFRWTPSHPHTHESARTAYGAPVPASAPASTGAVGVFPNAHVGGCGIPLLLSCNPSVVSGSLAKTHPPSYTAPSYRTTEDDFNFHSKRDVKLTEKLVKPLNRTPINNSNFKTNTAFVTKQ